MTLVVDGPHAFISGNDRFLIQYYALDPGNNNYSTAEKIIIPDNPEGRFRGFFNDQNKTYPLKADFTPEPGTFECSGKIMACGDVHGEYDLLVKRLSGASVIDENLSWTWGKGHLVFCGDVFDRGDQVTECLWFIHHLESQAAEQGGKVHFLLGNHEIMIMEGDKRYLSSKYLKLEKESGLDYSNLFGDGSVLGRWLRSKNTLIRINDYLFVHGGLSAALGRARLKPDEVNSIVRNWLINPSPIWRADVNTQLVMGENGPLWYRGYLVSWYERIEAGEIKDMLRFYEAERIIFAHTTVPRVRSLFNGLLLAIDTPLSRRSPGESLLIDGKNFYAIDWQGKKRQID